MWVCVWLPIPMAFISFRVCMACVLAREPQRRRAFRTLLKVERLGWTFCWLIWFSSSCSGKITSGYLTICATWVTFTATKGWKGFQHIWSPKVYSVKWYEYFMNRMCEIHMGNNHFWNYLRNDYIILKCYSIYHCLNVLFYFIYFKMHFKKCFYFIWNRIRVVKEYFIKCDFYYTPFIIMNILFIIS